MIAFVTHSIFPKESWKKFILPNSQPFTCFYTTNSCPEVTEIIKDKPPFIVLSLANAICETLFKY